MSVDMLPEALVKKIVAYHSCKILGVAARHEDGTVVTLPSPARHCHLWEEYNQHARSLGYDCPWIGFGTAFMDGVPCDQQGFYIERTTEGDEPQKVPQFLTREQAAGYAYAIGQITELKPRLLSEDLW